MVHINIKSVHIKNYRNISELKYDVTPGPKLVVGKNGSGKTSRYESILWCIYGKLIHGKSPVPFNRDAICQVSVDLEVVIDNETVVKMVVTRRHSGKKLKLQLSINGVEQYDGNSVKIQEYIKSIMPTIEIFKNLIWCGQDNTQLIDQVGSDRRSVWGKIYGFDKWEQPRKEAVANSASVGIELLKIESDLGLLNNSMEVYENSELKIKKLNNEIEEIQNDIYKSTGANTKEKLAEMQDDLKGLISSFDSSLSHINDTLIKNNSTYQKLGSHVASFKNGSCNVCGQSTSIDNENYTIMTQKMKSLSDFNSKLEKEKDAKRENLKEYNDVSKILSAASKMYFDIYTKQSQIDSIKELRDETGKNITVINEEIKRLTKEQNKLKILQDHYKFWANAFSSKGVINLQLKTLSLHFNKVVDKYTSIFYDDVVLRISDNFDYMVNWGGYEIDYNELSKGQRNRINLCCLMAMREISSGEWSCNLRVDDEVFDNIDSEGINGVSQLLQLYPDYVSSFVITHNAEVESLFSEVITNG